MENDKMEVTADLDDHWKEKSLALEKIFKNLARKCSEMEKISSTFLVNYSKVKNEPQIDKSPMDEEQPGYWKSKCKFLLNQISGMELLLEKSWPRKTEQEESLPTVEAQRKHPFEVYPEEIWRMIANELEDCWDDLYSLSKAHPSFNVVIKPAETTLRFHQAFGLIFNRLKKQDVSNCRKVCREWTAAIDQFLQFPSSLKCCDVLQLEPPPSTLSRPLSHYRAHIPIGWEPYVAVIGNIWNIKKYTSEMAEHPRNPFLCHALKFRMGWNSSICELSGKSCGTFLDQFGPHIWYLRLDIIGQQNRDELNCCQILEHSLSRLPNLKDLQIRYYADWDADEYGFGEEEEEDEEAVERRRDLKRYLKYNPFPELPKLVSFRGTYERVLPKLQDAILKRYGGQLRHVEVMDGTWDKYGGTLESLKELHILHLSLGKKESYLEKFKDLPVPLDKLCFRFSYDGRSKSIDSVIFLEILQHLETRVCCIQSERRAPIPDRCEYYCYDKPPKERIGWEILGASLPSALTVPSLEMLIINGQDIKISANFLKRLTNLRYFYYSPTMTNSLNNENIVEIKRNSNDAKLDQWNFIWEAVPSLEVIAVDKKYFSKHLEPAISLVGAEG